MRTKLSLSLLKASLQVLLGLKYFENIVLIIFQRKRGLNFLLQHAEFKNGHTYESINLMIDNSINVSKLHNIRKKKDSTFRSYRLHLLELFQFLETLNILSNFFNFLRLWGLQFF